MWIDHTGRGAVEITDCGGDLCGKVVWVADQANAKGCGLQILGDVKPMGDGTFDEGWIYDPDKDAKYDVELVPQGNKLKVVGYAGVKLFSQTFTWTRRTKSYNAAIVRLSGLSSDLRAQQVAGLAMSPRRRR